jgi:hypothetical protein
VHRENRYFVGRRSQRNTRAGGVSPPWEPCTRAQRLKITQSRRWYKSQPFAAPLNANATAIRTYTVGGPPNKHACVCANVFPTARRADGRRSCFGTRRVFATVCGIGVAGAFAEHPRRADARRS